MLTGIEQKISTPGLPDGTAQSLIKVRDSVQAEMNSGVFGDATEVELQSATAPLISGNKPVNSSLQVDSDSFIYGDPNIELNRVPSLENRAFADPVADIEHVVLHRTVTDTAQGAMNSFATPRQGTYYGTHFLVGRDGTISQTASLNNITYHVAGYNSETIGIEVVGMPLDANGNTTIGHPYGDPVSSWEPLSQEQTDSVAYLTNSLNAYYSLGAGTTKIHEDLAAKTEGEGGTVMDAIKHRLIP